MPDAGLDDSVVDGSSPDGGPSCPAGQIASAAGGCHVPWWSAPEVIQAYDAPPAGNAPDVAVDPYGNALAVWQELDGGVYNIWGNRYVPGTGWGTAVLLENDTGSAGGARVAVDGAGDGLVVWSQTDGTRYNIWANRHVPRIGWGTAVLIETDDAGDARVPQVAMDDAGNGLAVWQQSDGTRYNIWANRYVPGTGWGTAELIETDTANDAEAPQVAVDARGNGMAVWEQTDGTRYNIWANRYVPGTGWGTAELIETDNAGGAQYPQVAVDAAGDGLAVWHQYDGMRNNIWANRYALGTGWGTAELIETDNAGSAGWPQVGVDGAGNGVAVWQQSDGTRNNIWANRYVSGTGWGTAALIEMNDAGMAQNPEVAMNPAGDAVAVWEQSPGSPADINIWSAVFR